MIDNIYLPALDEIEENIKSSISFAEKSLKESKDKKNREIFKSNVESNKFSVKVLVQYRGILKNQRQSLSAALLKTNEHHHNFLLW